MKAKELLAVCQERVKKDFKKEKTMIKKIFIIGTVLVILVFQTGCTESMSRDFGQGARLFGGISDITGATSYFNNR